MPSQMPMTRFISCSMSRIDMWNMSRIFRMFAISSPVSEDSSRRPVRQAAGASDSWPARGRSRDGAVRRTEGCRLSSRPYRPCQRWTGDPEHVRGATFSARQYPAGAGSRPPDGSPSHYAGPMSTFSDTVSSLNKRIFWNVLAMPARLAWRCSYPSCFCLRGASVPREG